MHHAPLTAQQRTQYLSARMHLQRMPAHIVLAKLRACRLWYSAGAAMYPAKVPSVRQCVVTRALGEYAVAQMGKAPQPNLARSIWTHHYRVARMRMR